MESLRVVYDPIHQEDVGFRDAIHIPLIVMYLELSEDSLWVTPGTRVELKVGTKDTVVISSRSDNYGDDSWIGILNPYSTADQLIEGVDRARSRRRETGSHSEESNVVRLPVTVFLRPGLSTSVSHQYHYPMIDDVADKLERVNPHELWLRDYAQKYSFDFDQLIDGAKNGGYIVRLGYDLHGPEEVPEWNSFWEHLSALTGQKYDEEHRDSVGWSCSC